MARKNCSGEKPKKRGERKKEIFSTLSSGHPQGVYATVLREQTHKDKATKLPSPARDSRVELLGTNSVKTGQAKRYATTRIEITQSPADFICGQAVYACAAKRRKPTCPTITLRIRCAEAVSQQYAKCASISVKGRQNEDKKVREREAGMVTQDAHVHLPTCRKHAIHM